MLCVAFSRKGKREVTRARALDRILTQRASGHLTEIVDENWRL